MTVNSLRLTVGDNIIVHGKKTYFQFIYYELSAKTVF